MRKAVVSQIILKRVKVTLAIELIMRKNVKYLSQEAIIIIFI